MVCQFMLLIHAPTLNQVHVKPSSYYFTFEVSDLHNCIKSSSYYTELTLSMFHTIFATFAIPRT